MYCYTPLVSVYTHSLCVQSGEGGKRNGTCFSEQRPQALAAGTANSQTICKQADCHFSTSNKNYSDSHVHAHSSIAIQLRGEVYSELCNANQVAGVKVHGGHAE